MKIPAGVVVSGAGRVKYPRDLADYGDFYGRTEVAVRAWVRHGKKIGDLPPLDDAAEMVLWWKRNMKNAVPDYLERLAISDRPQKAPDPVRVAPAEPKPAGEAIELSTELAGSAVDSLNRLRAASALCFEQYQRALKEGDSAKADLWRKDWLAAEEKQRHWEKDITKIQLDRGELASKSALIPMLTTLAGTLRRNFIAGFKHYGRLVAPNLSEEELDAYAEPVVEEVFKKLRENELAAALRG